MSEFTESLKIILWVSAGFLYSLKRNPRKGDARFEGAASLRGAFQFQAAAMGAQDALGKRKPQADPFAQRLGCEEGVKDLATDRLRDTAAGIDHSQDDLFLQ